MVAEWAASGIYAITNARTGERYVGSAAIFGLRWGQHLQALREGKHQNGKLQAAWARDGAAAFHFAVLEVVADATILQACEQVWIDKLQPAYNVRRTAIRPGPRTEATSTPEPAPQDLPDLPVFRRYPHAGSRVRLPYLREWRRYEAFTQKELAARAAITKITITHLEMGRCYATLVTVGKLAEALGVTRQQLAYEPPPPSRIADPPRELVGQR